MMAQKHLHELLQEDQEPFQLNSYIADRRCQIRGPSEKTQLQIRKRKPITQNSNFPSNFCKNACFFSFNDSPDPRKSPMFEFSSPIKSPCRSPKNAIFLKIPAKTAALLLEAALRIQKSKQKNENKISSGLFGSLKRKLALTHKNRSQKREKDDDGVVKPSVKDILRWESSVGRRKSFKEKNEVVGSDEKSTYETSACGALGFSCSCNGRPSSAVWSESNEDKSLDLDLETSSSSHSNDSEEDDMEFASCEKRFCESPFRFVLERSPSCGQRTPDFSSPVTSPSRRYTEDRDDHDQIEILKKIQVESEEEDKEQCSPVSVLDPPFEDDDEGHLDDDVGGYDLDCSYAFVQRAKQQLLHKLRRFERLAELDPIELEKRMLEEDLDDDEFTLKDEGKEGCIRHKEYKFDGLIKEVFSNSSFNQFRRIPEDMKRLVSDLIEEEEREEIDEEVVVKRVCRRLESWKEVESNTIDMMVEQDFRREYDAWKRNQEQVGETAIEIELAILGLLLEELSEEFVV